MVTVSALNSGVTVYKFGYKMTTGTVKHVLPVFFHLVILTMILISSLHCMISICKVILMLNYLNRRNVIPFLMTLRRLIC